MHSAAANTPMIAACKANADERRHHRAAAKRRVASPFRELLATVDVAVGTDTMARFLAEVNGKQLPRRSSKRTSRRRAAVTVATAAPPSIPASAAPAHNEAPPERPRTRGQRVADPRNL